MNGEETEDVDDDNALTCVTGKWSGSLVMRLGTGGLRCRSTNDRDLRRAMLEKLVWRCAFTLVGAVNGGITVGEVAEKHTAEVEDLIVELASFCRFTLSVALKVGLLPAPRLPRMHACVHGLRRRARY